MTKRKYEQKRRAASREATRNRIVDAAIALHEEVGPDATTISALAERAGVQRLTVYRHFADEAEILQACSSKWFSANPPPDLVKLTGGDTNTTLHALYDYYRKTQRMWRSVYADVGRVEALEEVLGQFNAYLAGAEAALLAAQGTGRSRKLRATIRHAVQFSTWRSLNEQRLGTKTMAALVGDWIRAAAG